MPKWFRKNLIKRLRICLLHILHQPYNHYKTITCKNLSYIFLKFYLLWYFLFMLLKAILAYLRIQLFFPPLTTRKIILDKNSKHCLCSHTGPNSYGIGLTGGLPLIPFAIKNRDMSCWNFYTPLVLLSILNKLYYKTSSTT